MAVGWRQGVCESAYGTTRHCTMHLGGLTESCMQVEPLMARYVLSESVSVVMKVAQCARWACLLAPATFLCACFNDPHGSLLHLPSLSLPSVPALCVWSMSIIIGYLSCRRLWLLSVQFKTGDYKFLIELRRNSKVTGFKAPKVKGFSPIFKQVYSDPRISVIAASSLLMPPAFV